MNNRAADWHPPAEFRRHVLDADGLMGAQPFWGLNVLVNGDTLTAIDFDDTACPCQSAPRAGANDERQGEVEAQRPQRAFRF